jgi:uncharacterized BrkB/YihY/UPF0761 family membrane protein
MTKRLQRPHDYTTDFVDVIVTLATVPALIVGVAAYSFNYNAIHLAAWLFGEDKKHLWRYFHHYLLLLVLIWVLFVVIAFRRDHQRSLTHNSP